MIPSDHFVYLYNEIFKELERLGPEALDRYYARVADRQAYFALDGFKNLIGPVIRLRRLSDEELFALISRVTALYAQNYDQQPRVTEEEMTDFLNLCLARAGADSMITPREMLRDYMTVLNILMQNPNATFRDVVGSAVTLKTEANGEQEEVAPKNDFTPDDLDF